MESVADTLGRGRWPSKRYPIIRGNPLSVNMSAEGRLALNTIARKTGWHKSDIIEHLVRKARPTDFPK